VGWDAVDVPTRQAVRVEYPGYVRDMEAAVETLGGSLLSRIYLPVLA
jgi:hypothetical protein